MVDKIKSIIHSKEILSEKEDVSSFKSNTFRNYSYANGNKQERELISVKKLSKIYEDNINDSLKLRNYEMDMTILQHKIRTLGERINGKFGKENKNPNLIKISNNINKSIKYDSNFLKIERCENFQLKNDEISIIDDILNFQGENQTVIIEEKEFTIFCSSSKFSFSGNNSEKKMNFGLDFIENIPFFQAQESAVIKNLSESLINLESGNNKDLILSESIKGDQSITILNNTSSFFKKKVSFSENILVHSYDSKQPQKKCHTKHKYTIRNKTNKAPNMKLKSILINKNDNSISTNFSENKKKEKSLALEKLNNLINEIELEKKETKKENEETNKNTFNVKNKFLKKSSSLKFISKPCSSHMCKKYTKNPNKFHTNPIV
jgi:hypothetical protein